MMTTKRITIANCPHCGWTFGHDPECVSVTEPVTGRKAVLLAALDKVQQVKKLTYAKLATLDELTGSLNQELRRAYRDDEKRLRGLEQAVQRLEDAAAGGRAAVHDGEDGTPA